MLFTTRILRLGKTLGLSALFFTIPALANAQITPDGSLPTTVEQLQGIMQIEGGERTGDNLFHSFEEFNIRVGEQAIFDNALDIQNIFTRITGGEASTLDGLLQTQGGANLFFINPAGVVFGENFQLDVGGSFVATTADSVQFEDGSSFVANGGNPNVSLTISLPVGLTFDGENGSITVNDTGNLITNDSTFSPVEFSNGKTSGLSVPLGETLALVGNGIDFNGGVINSEGSQVFLLSLDSGSVDIDQTTNELSLNDNNTTSFQDINLSQQSIIDAGGEGESNISLTGNDISISDGSFILNQGDSSGASINLTASESLTLSGNSPDGEISSSIRSEVLENGKTKGSDINISTQKLRIRNQGQIQAGTFSDAVNGLGGDININVSDIVELDDGLISASTFSQGNAGNIKLLGFQVRVKNTASLTSSTTGSGNGGNIEVNADTVELVGSLNDARSTVSASSLGTGDAGSITIDTKELRIADGASFSTTSFGNGNAGDILINSEALITVDGNNSNLQSNNETQSTTIRSSVEPIDPVAQQIFNLPAVPSGNAGNVTITTPELNVTNEGKVSAQNQGTGQGGQVTINADDLNLEGGSITAETASGKGGNVQINTSNLTSKKNSEISTNAESLGNGGNITINSDTILGVENNDDTFRRG